MVFKLHSVAKTGILLGLMFALTSVVLGAFAAHGLKANLDEYSLAIFETGARYQMYHGLGLAVIGLLCGRSYSKYFEYAIWLMSMGIVFFSGSLYILALTSYTQLGMITPVGGVFLIMAWLACFVGVMKS